MILLRFANQRGTTEVFLLPETTFLIKISAGESSFDWFSEKIFCSRLLIWSAFAVDGTNLDSLLKD